MPNNVFPALLSTSKCICDVIRSDIINYSNKKENKLLLEAKTKKPKMLRFLAVLYIAKFSEFHKENWKKNQGGGF